MITVYRCPKCGKIYHDIFDDVSKLNINCLFCSSCGETVNEVEVDCSSGNTLKIKKGKIE